MRNIHQKILRSRRGFLIIIAVIVSGILISIGVGIANLSLKELLISTTGRDSLYAFYTSDSGVECIYYWDNVRDDPNLTSKFNIGVPEDEDDIECNSVLIDPGTPNFSYIKEFKYNLDLDQQDECVKASVAKNDIVNPPRTTILSWGFNTACDAVSPRKLDRAIRSSYNSR
jgi:hypothetical protein